MKKKSKIYAMIPARIGSQRLKFENLALINNKPLIYYAINSSKKSKVFNKIFLNSDHDIFYDITKKYKINFHKREKKYGGSNIKSDDVVYEFLKKNNCDIIMWINPIAPMIHQKDIKKIKNYFIKKKLNSLITTNFIQAHALCNNKPINFLKKEKFAKTQD